MSEADNLQAEIQVLSWRLHQQSEEIMDRQALIEIGRSLDKIRATYSDLARFPVMGVPSGIRHP
ncbi:MAG: hypothetical protein RIA09_16055 [Hoeflea sp.]|jgi:hypothetical protein|uniref:hypothetical protein n=1 Tax=Hoeflea sp. TaxID=1940281 RepID=UPI0032F08E4D